jgi:hypothetical protein
MAVRGIGVGLERARHLLGHSLGMDEANTDAFFQHWLAPNKLGGILPGAALLTPGFTTPTREAGQQVQNVSDAINVAPERQNQTGNIIANATGQLAGLIGIAAVGGEGAVDTSLLGQGFDQIDQSLKQGGKKPGKTASGDVATLVGGPVTAVIEKTGLDAVLEGVPLPIKSRVLRGLADTILVGGYEAAEEVAQQIVQNFATKLGLDPNTPVRDWPKGLGEGLEPNAVGGFGAGFIARAIMGRWGGHRAVMGHADEAPLGMREAGALQPDITPEDEASPLPTDLIAQGKMTIGAADGTTKANQVLRASGIPDVGTRVTVSHNGRQQHGAVADAWTVNVAGQDSVGVKIRLDDGTMIEEPIDTLRDMGVSITPVQLPSGLPEQDLANPVVQQFAAEGMANVDDAVRQTPFESETTVEVNGEKRTLKVNVPSGTPLRSNANIPQDVVQGLIAHGIPEHVARGAAAGVVAESGGHEAVSNPQSGAFGLGQWLGSRKQALFDRYGPEPYSSSANRIPRPRAPRRRCGRQIRALGPERGRGAPALHHRLHAPGEGPRDDGRHRARPCGPWDQAGDAGRPLRR